MDEGNARTQLECERWPHKAPWCPELAGGAIRLPRSPSGPPTVHCPPKRGRDPPFPQSMLIHRFATNRVLFTASIPQRQRQRCRNDPQRGPAPFPPPHLPNFQSATPPPVKQKKKIFYFWAVVLRFFALIWASIGRSISPLSNRTGFQLFSSENIDTCAVLLLAKRKQ